MLGLLFLSFTGSVALAESGPEKVVKKRVTELLESIYNQRDIEKIKSLVHPGAEFINYLYLGIRKHDFQYWLDMLPPHKGPNPPANFKFLSVQVTGYTASVVVEAWVAKNHLVTQHLLLYKLKQGWQVVSKAAYLPGYQKPLDRKEIHLQAADLAGYPGYYKTAEGIMILVSQKDSHLFITLPGQKAQEIFPESKTRFFVKIADSRITFLPGPGGKARLLELNHGQGIIRANRVEPKVGVFAGSRPTLGINLVVAGPFTTEEEALAGYKTGLPENWLLLQTDTRNLKPGWYIVESEPWITEADLEDVKRLQSASGDMGLDLTFTPKAANKLHQLTSKYKGKRAAYIVAGKVVLAPRIAAVMSRRARLVGRFTAEEISKLLVELNLAISKNKSK